MENIIGDLFARLARISKLPKNSKQDDDDGKSEKTAKSNFVELFFQYWTEGTDTPIYFLFYEIYKETINQSKQCNFEIIELTLLQCLPRQFLRFLQDCCNYLNLLKTNVESDEKYCIILNNFAKHVTNYLVYLHGIYIIKKTPGRSSEVSFSIEEYCGEATFSTEEDRQKTYIKYFIAVNIIFDKLLRCKENIELL